MIQELLYILKRINPSDSTPSWFSLEQIVVNASGIEPPARIAPKSSKSEHIFNTVMHPVVAVFGREEHIFVGWRMHKSKAGVTVGCGQTFILQQSCFEESFMNVDHLPQTAYVWRHPTLLH